MERPLKVFGNLNTDYSMRKAHWAVQTGLRSCQNLSLICINNNHSGFVEHVKTLSYQRETRDNRFHKMKKRNREMTE